MAKGAADLGVDKPHNMDRLPEWLRTKHPLSRLHTMRARLKGRRLNTVCEEARCPNRAECFSRPTATFLIMGPVCTRNCSFCSVESGAPGAPLEALDNDEPRRVAEAAREMGLRYVVVTSVTRDDLPDGGAGMFSATIRALRQEIKGVRVEVLVPDFGGDMRALETVLDACPDVLNHNIETVPSLYPAIRPMADYRRSLAILRAASMHGGRPGTKSGLMLGFGESMAEVRETLRDLRDAGCDLLTIGQYMRPSRGNVPVREYIEPAVFDKLGITALGMGFSMVASAPLARSSMHAEELYSSYTYSGDENVRV